MKVLQICHKPPFPPIDGGCKAMHQVTEILLEANMDVQVLAIETFKHPVNIHLQDENYRTKTKFASSYVDIKVKPIDALLNLFSNESYNISRFWNKDFAKLISERLQTETFDIIQLESLYVAPYLPIIRKFSKAKVVYRAHNIEHRIWESNQLITKSFLKKAYLKFLVKRLKKFETNFVKKVDFIVAISPIDANWIQSKTDKKVEVIPFGMKKPEDKAIQKKDICYLGALDWYPNQLGLEWFLKNVWSEIHQSYPDVKFNIAGRGAPNSILNWKYPGVNVLGEVDDASEFIEQHAIMLVPLFAGSGIRIKILEGLAHKQAILSTSIGAQGLELKDGKHILIADSKEEFCSQLKKLVNDKLLRDKLSENGFKQFEENYSLETIKNKWINFYQSME